MFNEHLPHSVLNRTKSLLSWSLHSNVYGGERKEEGAGNKQAKMQISSMSLGDSRYQDKQSKR